MEGRVIRNEPSKYLVDYLEGQGVVLPKDLIKPGEIILKDADLLNHDAPQETEEIRKVRAEFEGGVKPSSAIPNQSPNMNSVPATGTVTNVGQAPSMNQPIPNSIPNTQPPGNQPGSRPVMPNTTPTSNGNTGTTIEAPKVNFRINPNKFE